VDFHRLVNESLRFFEGPPDRDAARKIWNIGAITGAGFFENYRVSAQFLIPACLTIDFSVPSGTSSEE
jgi:hypothetical protein